MNIPDQWVKEAIRAAEIAQERYKNTPLNKPWPEWEKQAEKAKQTWINAQKRV